MTEPIDPIQNTRRTLAAIVFSDIVNFSRLTQENEDRTLGLSARDLKQLRKICEMSEGKVLKHTGDGLLMYFDSAIQAVACAMRAQAHFAAMAEKLPPEETLQHRIGIHLGDVFVSSDDVMGDGVNIASRLQEEAPPGGICVSQTVYDVVKNRLSVKVTPLGPRELKNIKEAMPVYQILLEAAGADAAEAAASSTHPGRWKWIAGIAAAVLVATVGVGIYTWPKADNPADNQADSREEESPFDIIKPQKIADAPAADKSTADAPADDASATGTPATTASADTGPVAPGSTRPTEIVARPANRRTPPERNRPGPSEEEIDKARCDYLPSRDFAGMVRWLNERKLGQSPLGRRYKQLIRYQKLVRMRMRMADEDDPIVIQSRRDGRMQRIEVWGDGVGIKAKISGEIVSLSIEEIPLEDIVAVYSAIARAPRQHKLVKFFVQECNAAELLKP
ncbi:MAG: hypothetical protein K8S55_11995 [Phycisphaerae bacterium]|nr:hypothetical protein [Phycisphaerae bacterium]